MFIYLVPLNLSFFQVPLVYCFMTGRREVDYAAVLEFIRSLCIAPVVKKTMMDFELAAWNAFARLFPGIQLAGCSFHFSQAVMKRVGKLGLKRAYQDDPAIRHSIGKLLCLCYLHRDEIRGVFHDLQRTAPPRLTRLFAYVSRNWVHGNTWTTEKWSVFDRIVRTNNHAEGEHNKWKKSATHSNLTCYSLADFLFGKVKDLDMTETMVRHGKLTQAKSVHQREKDQALADVWEEYKTRKGSAEPMLPMDLLNRAVHITRRQVVQIPDSDFDWGSDDSIVSDDENVL